MWKNSTNPCHTLLIVLELSCIFIECPLTIGFPPPLHQIPKNSSGSFNLWVVLWTCPADNRKVAATLFHLNFQTVKELPGGA